jgi:hypothetical protein
MDFEIVSVKSKADLMRFIKSQWNFYKGDKNFVPPLLADRKKLLNTKINPFYQHSEIEMFLAISNGQVIGRIAAITNENHNITHNDKVGFFGFFECINDQKVADKLFEAAGSWLKSKGKDIMRGPENPSQNDECGLLIEGFDSPNVILSTYNPDYYPSLIENSNFVKAKDLYAYHITQANWSTPKLERLQNIVRERYKVTIREMNFKNKLQFQKDVETIKNIYNQAWEPNWGFVKMTDDEFDFLADDLKQIADSRLAFFIEVDKNPVGFCLALPDINQCLIHNKKGALLGAAWHLFTKKKKINWLRILVLGIIPKYQKYGLDAILYYEMGIRGPAMGIYDGEASWILEDNIMMNRGLTVTLNGRLYKKFRLYERPL